MFKWDLVSTTTCKCGTEDQMTDDIISNCSLQSPSREMNCLTSLDETTIAWLQDLYGNLTSDHTTNRESSPFLINCKHHHWLALLYKASNYLEKIFNITDFLFLKQNFFIPRLNKLIDRAQLIMFEIARITTFLCFI